jgi:geranylgeranyl pyrophosphate synthase
VITGSSTTEYTEFTEQIQISAVIEILRLMGKRFRGLLLLLASQLFIASKARKISVLSVLSVVLIS